MTNDECYFSVDIETSGTVVGRNAILSIGAVPIDDVAPPFYALLKPLVFSEIDPRAMEINGLNIAFLRQKGEAPFYALQRFSDWVLDVAEDRMAVPVCHNCSFDIGFLAHYYGHFRLPYPFHYAALDTKSYYLGLCGSTWRGTSYTRIPKHLAPPSAKAHDALEDAKAQAQLFRNLRKLQRGNEINLANVLIGEGR